jgi:hypothetical protein
MRMLPDRKHSRQLVLAALPLLAGASCPLTAATAATPQVATITGELSGILLVAVPLAFILSLALLAIYLRAVKRSMLRQSAGSQSQGPETAPVTVMPVAALKLIDISTKNYPTGPAEQLATTAAHGLWRVAAVYAVAGLMAAVAMALLYMIGNDIALLPLRTAFVMMSYAWPVMLMISLLALSSWTGWAAAIGLYLLTLAAVIVPSLSTIFTPLTAATAWLIHNGPATLMVLVFLARPIRAVGPLVMAFSFAAVAGASILANAIGATDARMQSVADLGYAIGLGGHQTFVAVLLVGFILFAIIGWLLLRVLGWLYRTRRVSDQSIMIDSLWLMFTMHHAIDMAFVGFKWFAATFAVFGLYKLIVSLGFKLTRPAAATQVPALLLLRVFSLGKRSEQLFDVFAKRWRHAGTIRMIAGPDLAKTTVAPHEFLDFVSGKLARRFIDGPATLEQRLTESEPRRDIDGRYRVTDFFCHDDTWKLVLRRLARDSDVVLMDLRGFTRSNKGCVFEIHALLDDVAFSRLVFVIDATTDAAFLSETLTQGWAMLAASSPNRTDAEPTVGIFKLAGNRNTGQLLRAVAGAAHGAAA